MSELALFAWDAARLGYVEADGFSVSSDVTFHGLQVADGPTRYRQDRAVGPITAPIQCIMTRDQFRYFEYWFYWTLLQGWAWFTMPLRTSQGLADVDCHMIGKYKAQFMGGRERPHESYWDVQFEVEMALSTTRGTVPHPPGITIAGGTADRPSTVGEIHAGTATVPSTGGIIEGGTADTAI